MYRFRALLKTQKPLRLPSGSSLSVRTCSSTPKIEPQSAHSDKKPLSVLFEEVVGLREKSDTIYKEIDDAKGGKNFNSKLGELLREVRDLKPRNDKPDRQRRAEEPRKGGRPENVKPLSSLFLPKKQPGNGKKENERREAEDSRILKDLSRHTELFVRHLYREGYFNGANFLRGNKLDLGCFDSIYSRTFTVNVSEKFGRDHQDIAKWLSGSNLKKVALFGCPSHGKSNVFAAKRVRKFFDIQENNVCRKCLLKDSCKFVNKAASSWTKDLILADVLRIVLLYAVDLVDSQLKVTGEIIESVHHLLEEIIKLSKDSSKSLC